MIGAVPAATARPLYTAPAAELSAAMTAWVLKPFGPANRPVGSIAGFHPTMVPSSVAKRNTAGADVIWPALFGPVIGKAPLPRLVLNTVPVGVPPVSPSGVGMLTTNGTVDTAVLPAPGT